MCNTYLKCISILVDTGSRFIFHWNGSLRPLQYQAFIHKHRKLDKLQEKRNRGKTIDFRYFKHNHNYASFKI